MYNGSLYEASLGKYSHKVARFDYEDEVLGINTIGQYRYGLPDLVFCLTAQALIYHRMKLFRKEGFFSDNFTVPISVFLTCNDNSYGRPTADPRDYTMPSCSRYGLYIYTLMEKDCTTSEEYLQMTQARGHGTGMSAYFKATRHFAHSEELTDVELFLKQQTGVTSYIFYREESAVTVVYFREDDAFRAKKTAAMHALASCLPRLMPWMFKLEQLIDEENEMLAALLSDESMEEFAKKLEVIFAGANGKFLSIEDTATYLPFEGLHLQKLSVQCNNASDRLYQSEEDLRCVKRRLKECYERWRRDKMESMTLVDALADSDGKLLEKDHELAEYFASNKAVKVKKVLKDRGEITFGVFTPLKNFDPDIYDTYASNENSIFYDYDNCDYDLVGLSMREVRMLLDAIFSTEEVELMMRGDFSYVGGSGWKYLGNLSSPNGIANPHLNHFTCFGDYGPSLDEYAYEDDIISFVETCVASVGSLNIGEAITVQRFLKDIFYEDPNFNEYDEDEREAQELNSTAMFRFKGETTLLTISEVLGRLKENEN